MPNEPGSIATLRKYSKRRQTVDSDQFYESLKSESDRAAIILTAAGLEDTLYLKLCGTLTNWDDVDDLDALFDLNRPLSSFSAKIDLSFFLGLIDLRAREQLHAIRAMRNACAHMQYAIEFTTPELAAVCRRIFAPRGFIPNPPDASHLRATFLMEANMLDHVIMFGSRQAAAKDMADTLKKNKIPVPEWLFDQG